MREERRRKKQKQKENKIKTITTTKPQSAIQDHQQLLKTTGCYAQLAGERNCVGVAANTCLTPRAGVGVGVEWGWVSWARGVRGGNIRPSEITTNFLPRVFPCKQTYVYTDIDWRTHC